MELQPSRWPRRLALLYVAIVLAVWALAISSDSAYQNWIFVVGLPWSLLLAGSRLLGSPLGLVVLFFTGILNARMIYLIAARRRHNPVPGSTVPPAA
jgi:hypothetical protein